MLDSRKLFIAFVLSAVAAGSAFAQGVTLPISCVAQAAGTPSIRAEGVAEQVGDVLIICQGGTPTPANTNLSQVNIQVFSSPSINITSRILSSATLNNFTEALLFIDEPVVENQPLLGGGTAISDKQTICGSPAYPYSIPLNQNQSQTTVSGVCGAHAGAPLGNGIGTYDPDVVAPSLPCIGGVTATCPTYRGNAYQARLASNNSLIWQGIPFDPPGTLTSRILRITNVRVNASQLGVPAGSQASVSLVISTSASGVGNPIALPITNPAPTVAIAQPSLAFSVAAAYTCRQCQSGNATFAGSPSSTLTTPGNACDGLNFSLLYRELFPTVFRRRNQVQPTPGTTGTTPGSPLLRQDTLGLIYQTETGFYKAGPNNTNANRWPTQITQTGNSSVVAGQSSGTLGLADSGTRLLVNFTNVQNGLQLWMPVDAGIYSPQANNVRTGSLRLVTTDPNGAGPFSPTAAGTTIAAPAYANNGPSGPLGWSGLAQVSVIGGTGQMAYEVVNADTTAVEQVNIPVVVAYIANTSANLPSLGTASASGSLAPLSTVSTASTSAPLPRFINTASNQTLLTINSCRTNILFPFVTNQAGFDTGLAIANTSKDPFGTSLQTGACTVNFYGLVGTSQVCLSYPSPSITGGQTFVWTLSNGGAVTATAGFQGYVIAQCAFQYGHGFAFVSDLGATTKIAAYIALVMDTPTASRTGSTSEVLGH